MTHLSFQPRCLCNSVTMRFKNALACPQMAIAKLCASKTVHTSGKQRRLSTAIALSINVWTHRSTHFTLNNRRLCILCDHSSGVEHFDIVRAVLWVTYNFSTSPEDWTVLTLFPDWLYQWLFNSFMAQFTTLKSLDYDNCHDVQI